MSDPPSHWLNNVSADNQALILCGHDAPLGECVDLARRIAFTARRWRPPPDRTLLIVDDLDTCLSRYARRAPVVPSQDDRVLIARAAQVYRALAEQDTDRFTVIDRRGLGSDQTVDSICRHVRETT